MSILPVISGEKAVKYFEKQGYVVIRQKGSHIRMQHKSDGSKKPLTIPKHKVLGGGTVPKRSAVFGTHRRYLLYT